MIDFLLSMVLDTNLFTHGQVARLDSHAHSSRLLKSRGPGDITHVVHAAGENRSGKRAPLAKIPCAPNLY
jgi:hypothetical protein